jgi:hypothetical protein
MLWVLLITCYLLSYVIGFSAAGEKGSDWLGRPDGLNARNSHPTSEGIVGAAATCRTSS